MSRTLDWGWRRVQHAACYTMTSGRFCATNQFACPYVCRSLLLSFASDVDYAGPLNIGERSSNKGRSCCRYCHRRFYARNRFGSGIGQKQGQLRVMTNLIRPLPIRKVKCSICGCNSDQGVNSKQTRPDLPNLTLIIASIIWCEHFVTSAV